MDESRRQRMLLDLLVAVRIVEYIQMELRTQTPPEEAELLYAYYYDSMTKMIRMVEEEYGVSEYFF